MNQQLIEQIKYAAAAFEEEELALLKEFSGINCNTGNEEGNRRVVEIICKILEEMGAEIQLQYCEGYGSHIIAKLQSDKKENGSIIISAHTDTAFNQGDVEAHPYHEEENKAYGLGITDCKGGLVVAVYALKIAQELKLLPKKEFKLLFTCDEEVGAVTGKMVYEKEVPGCEGAFVFERGRGDGGPITSRKGVIEGKVETFGKSDHAARYELARSAVEELAYKIIDLKQAGDYDKKRFYSVGPVHCDTHINKVPDYAYAEFCVVTGSGQDQEEIKKFLEDLEKTNHVNGCSTKITWHVVYPPMEWMEKHSKIAQFYVDAGRLLGYSFEEQSNNSVGDASYFAKYGVATCDGLGTMGENTHNYNEYIEKDSVKKRTELFTVTLGLLGE